MKMSRRDDVDIYCCSMTIYAIIVSSIVFSNNNTFTYLTCTRHFKSWLNYPKRSYAHFAKLKIFHSIFRSISSFEK